jgi:hypothetical protein
VCSRGCRRRRRLSCIARSPWNCLTDHDQAAPCHGAETCPGLHRLATYSSAQSGGNHAHHDQRRR